MGENGGPYVMDYLYGEMAPWAATVLNVVFLSSWMCSILPV